MHKQELLANKQQMAREYIWLLEEKYSNQHTPEFEVDMARIIAGEPVAYVIGFVDFLGCRIELGAKPLIPREETAWWVGQVINDYNQSALKKPLRILDLFSGSGCIGIAMAKHIPAAKVLCAELDPKLVEQIQHNAALNGVSSSVDVVESDVFCDIPKSMLKEKFNGKFDLIVANPPYLSKSRKDAIALSVLKHEPHRALFAGDDGLYFLKHLLLEAPKYLTEEGELYMELDPWQKEPLEEFFSTQGEISGSSLAVSFHTDQFGMIRLLRAKSKQ